MTRQARQHDEPAYTPPRESADAKARRHTYFRKLRLAHRIVAGVLALLFVVWVSGCSVYHLSGKPEGPMDLFVPIFVPIYLATVFAALVLVVWSLIASGEGRFVFSPMIFFTVVGLLFPVINVLVVLGLQPHAAYAGLAKPPGEPKPPDPSRFAPMGPVRFGVTRAVGVLMLLLAPCTILTVVGFAVGYEVYGKESLLTYLSMIGHFFVIGLASLSAGLLFAIGERRVSSVCFAIAMFVPMAIPLLNTFLLVTMGFGAARDPNSLVPKPPKPSANQHIIDKMERDKAQGAAAAGAGRPPPPPPPTAGSATARREPSAPRPRRVP